MPNERNRNTSTHLQPDETRSSSSEVGSATIEFVVFALPLFVASLIFFISMHSSALMQSQGRELAREAVHAFVSARSDREGYVVVARLIQSYESARPSTLDASTGDFPHGEIINRNSPIHFSIRCSSYPCISPSNSVSLQLFRIDESNRRIPIASARSSVSKWTP
jgi:hypothetical protein